MIAYILKKFVSSLIILVINFLENEKTTSLPYIMRLINHPVLIF